MNVVNIYPRQFQWLPAAGATLLFSATGGTVLVLDASVPWLVEAFAWAMLVMAGIGMLGVISCLRTPNPIVVISDEGINYVPSPFGVVPWEEIVHVGVRNSGLVVAVKDNKHYFSKLPRLSRCRWWSGLSLPGELLLIPRSAVDVELLFKDIESWQVGDKAA